MYVSNEKGGGNFRLFLLKKIPFFQQKYQQITKTGREIVIKGLKIAFFVEEKMVCAQKKYPKAVKNALKNAANIVQ